jgi:diacylglycerol kinase (ATP)
MRLHVAAALATLIAALILHVDRIGLVAVLFAVALVFVTELANTALEAAVDLATDTFDPLAKTAKDVAAGAVLVAAVNAVVVGFLVLFEPVRAVTQNGITWVESAPAGLTVIALGLVVLVVLVLKAASREGSFLHGGWPSGHTAIAFGSATALGYITGSASALVLAFFIASLVGQSRLETEVHTVPQVIVGALLGALIVTAVFQLFFV